MSNNTNNTKNNNNNVRKEKTEELKENSWTTIEIKTIFFWDFAI